MNKNAPRSKIFYINIALAVSVVFILLIMIRPLFIVSKIESAGSLQPKRSSRPAGQAIEQTYDIKKIKEAVRELKRPQKVFSDFNEMYAGCSIVDAGSNIVDAWSKVNPKEKARVLEGFNKQVEDSREKLKANPDDKHAKNILHITEMMKQMADNGFNYKFKKEKDGSGAKEKVSSQTKK